MKYSAIIISLAATVFAIPQASSVTSAPASAASAALTPQQSCAVACPASDLDCQAECLGVAHPNSSQASETTECAAKCDQGDGSPEDTQKYSDCVQGCISSHFPTSQTVAPAAGSNAPSAAVSATGSAASAAASGASRTASGTATGTGSESNASGTASGSAASSSETGAANSNNIQVVGAGFAGLVMAMFAL